MMKLIGFIDFGTNAPAKMFSLAPKTTNNQDRPFTKNYGHVLQVWTEILHRPGWE